MKTAALNEIKNELSTKTHAQILRLCIRLLKYRKENKELLAYLLFEAHNEQAYIKGIKNEMNLMFDEINRSNVYFVKKSLRKILRLTNKHIRYSGIKETEVELLLYFCRKIKDSGILPSKSLVLNNIYQRQVLKINKSILLLHEDLQHDYAREMESLTL